MGAKGSVSFQLSEIFEQVTNEVEAAIDEGLKAAPKVTKQELRSTSPERTGAYAKGWRIVRHRKTKSAIVHNEKKPSITHLLERGHVIRNKYGEYGRVAAKPHIEAASEKGIQTFIDTVESKLDRDL